MAGAVHAGAIRRTRETGHQFGRGRRRISLAPRRSFHQRASDRFPDIFAEFRDLAAVIGMHAVGQGDDVDALLGVDTDGGAGVAGVTVGEEAVDAGGLGIGRVDAP